MATRPHVVIVTIPAPGHTIPFTAVAQKLVALGIQVTCLTSGKPNEQLLHSCGKAGIRFQGLLNDPFPPGEMEQLEWMQKLGDDEMAALLEAFMHTLTPFPCSILSDIYVGWTQVVADRLNIPRHVMYTMPAAALSLQIMVPTLVDQGLLPKSAVNESMPIKVPGLPPLYSSDIWETLKSREHPYHETTVRSCRRLRDASLILINSYEDLDHDIFQAMRSEVIGTANVQVREILPIGPLLPADAFRNDTALSDNQSSSDATDAEKWLDSQAPSSVLYISFGTHVALTVPQSQELAAGLESSGQPFLWVFRPPGVPHIVVPDSQPVSQKEEGLPLGFEERVKGRGLLIRGWASQLRILAHKSTGAFLTHCGWNSTLETICVGVPIVAWPFYVDQKTISRWAVDTVKVAMELHTNGDGVADRKEVERVVMAMLSGDEGTAARRKATQLSILAREAVTQSGSSVLNMEKFASGIHKLVENSK